MNTKLLLLLLLFSNAFSTIEAKSIDVIRDSFIYPRAITIEAVGGIDGSSVYPSLFGVYGALFEFPRRHGFGFATGFSVINVEGADALAFPVMFIISSKDPRAQFKIGFGAIAQLGAGQPFFFPKMDTRLRFALGQSGTFMDLIGYIHFRYRYACRNGSYSCSYIANTGFAGSLGVGLGLGFSKRKKKPMKIILLR